MNRREFIAVSAALFPAFMFAGKALSLMPERYNISDTDSSVFAVIMAKAKSGNWVKLPIGEIIAKIGQELLGTPYLGGTLEGSPEKCTVTLINLDCVTFFEGCLVMARQISAGLFEYKDLIRGTTFTRYRSGILADYTSRLHYTSDWIEDNVKKHVISDVSRELGGKLFNLDVHYMSKNFKSYPALSANPGMVPVIAEIEKHVNSTRRYYIPKGEIEEAEPRIQSGDIIAICTSIKGLDYGHTGLALRNESGELRFMHASSKKKKVIIDVPLHEHVNSFKNDTGVSIFRPLELIKKECFDKWPC